mgnify:CR=1 FL=1
MGFRILFEVQCTQPCMACWVHVHTPDGCDQVQTQPGQPSSSGPEDISALLMQVGRSLSTVTTRLFNTAQMALLGYMGRLHLHASVRVASSCIMHVARSTCYSQQGALFSRSYRSVLISTSLLLLPYHLGPAGYALRKMPCLTWRRPVAALAPSAMRTRSAFRNGSTRSTTPPARSATSPTKVRGQGCCMVAFIRHEV